MTRILGIDFSGASDAGNKIWIAEGRKSAKPFRLDTLLPAAHLPGGSRQLEPAIAALRAYICSEAETIAGCDFPFSLPTSLVGAHNWTDFVALFPQRFTDPAAFHDRCHREADGHELKRLTDRIERTPFCSYNLRLYRQGWWGIAHLLHPLLAAKAIVVRPQQKLRAGRPVLIEVCPASSLRRWSCYSSYKGNETRHRRARRLIIERLIEFDLLLTPSPRFMRQLIENPGGDALDAIIAAIAAAKADISKAGSRVERLEGRVYV